MSNYYLNWLMGITLASLFSCTNSTKILPEFSLNFIDTLSFNFEENTIFRNTCLSKINDNEYLVNISPYQRKLTFRNVFQPTDSFSSGISKNIQMKYGIFDFYVKSLDSIFILPDNGNTTNLLVLINSKGSIVEQWDLNINRYDSIKFATSGSYVNRIQIKNNKLYSNRFPQSYTLNNNGSRSNSLYYKIPHEIVFDLGKERIYLCGFYPTIMNSNQYTSGIVLKTLKGDSIYWAYSHVAELHLSIEEDSYSNASVIDISEDINFKLKKIENSISESQMIIEADIITSFNYDKYRNVFYLTYTKGIDFSKPDGFTNATSKEKPLFFVVFDENFKLIYKVELGTNSNYFGATMFVSKKGVLFPTRNTTGKFREYYLAKIKYE